MMREEILAVLVDDNVLGYSAPLSNPPATGEEITVSVRKESLLQEERTRDALLWPHERT